MFNIFPFDNSITKMQLSGLEVQELFDFAARRTAGRGCASQIQIAGARVRINCAGCDRVNLPCKTDAECTGANPPRTSCDTSVGKCVKSCDTDLDCSQSIGGTCDGAKKVCVVSACAEQVYIGHGDKRCVDDKACNAAGVDGPGLPGICDKTGGKADGLCLSLISPTNLYELATSNYLAGGGSGFRVLQRNTTQVDTKVQQRDALIDYLRAGKPCGYDPVANNTPDGLKACTTDPDCGDPNQVCSCPGHVVESGSPVTCTSNGACDTGNGRCVRKDCRDGVAQFHAKRCNDAPNQLACRTPVAACALAGEECKLLSCIDKTIGGITDNRVELIGR
jgi:5'-nucleotidase